MTSGLNTGGFLLGSSKMEKRFFEEGICSLKMSGWKLGRPQQQHIQVTEAWERDSKVSGDIWTHFI